MLEMSAWNSLWWPIFVINSVDNIKLPCCTHPLMQHNSFFRNYSPFLLLVSGSAAPVILNIEFFTGIWIFSQILIVLINLLPGMPTSWKQNCTSDGCLEPIFLPSPHPHLNLLNDCFIPVSQNCNIVELHTGKIMTIFNIHLHHKFPSLY